jgi:hypothetical protein
MGNFITSPLIQGGRTHGVAGARLEVPPTNYRPVMRDLRASPALNTAALGRALWHAGRNFDAGIGTASRSVTPEPENRTLRLADSMKKTNGKILVRLQATC